MEFASSRLYLFSGPENAGASIGSLSDAGKSVIEGIENLKSEVNVSSLRFDAAVVSEGGTLGATKKGPVRRRQ